MRRSLLLLSLTMAASACNQSEVTPTAVSREQVSKKDAAGAALANGKKLGQKGEDATKGDCSVSTNCASNDLGGIILPDDSIAGPSKGNDPSGDTADNTSNNSDSRNPPVVSGPTPLEFVEAKFPSRTINGGSVGACHEFSQAWVEYNNISFRMGSAGPGGDTITYWLKTANSRNYLVASAAEVAVGDLIITDANTSDLVSVHIAVVAKVLGGGQVQIAEASYFGFNTVSTHRTASLGGEFFSKSASQGVISLAKLRAGGGI